MADIGDGGSAVIAAIIALTIALVIVVARFELTGWTDFSYSAGDSPSWSGKGADISHLRFRDCEFVVLRGDGIKRTADVTAVLNGMAVAYAGGLKNPSELTLTRPLNPFSFVIAGFNDAATVSDPTVAPWCTSPPATCKTDADCPGSACVGGTCATCPGGAKVTLTGKVRVL